MAEITKKSIRRGELARAAIKVLVDCPDGLPAKEVIKRVESIVPPTAYEDGAYPNNPKIRRFDNSVRFATIGPVKAGWLIKSKGKWQVTDEGTEAYRKFPTPEQFGSEIHRLYWQWADSRPEEPDAEVDSVETPKSLAADTTPSAATTLEEAEEVAWAEIEQHLTTMPPYDFQSLVAALLKAMGYHVSWIAPPGPDRGIDIVAHTNPLGTSVPRIKVQVKRRANKITAEGLRSFMAVLGEHDVGIFVCSGGFTPDAEMEARTQEKRKITLMNLERLFDLWVLHYDRISEAEKHLLPLRPIYYLAPSE
jgi:restriction system protein